MTVTQADQLTLLKDALEQAVNLLTVYGIPLPGVIKLALALQGAKKVGPTTRRSSVMSLDSPDLSLLDEAEAASTTASEIAATATPVASTSDDNAIPPLYHAAAHVQGCQCSHQAEELPGSGNGKKWYVVVRGIRPGVYHDPGVTTLMTSGISHGYHESFTNELRAQEFYETCKDRGHLEEIPKK